MKFEGFVGPGYLLRNIQYDCQRTTNWYPEVNEVGKGKDAEIAQLIPRRGLLNRIPALNGPSRGGYVGSNNVIYWVFGSKLYSISTSSWTATILGTVPGGTSTCFFTDNGDTLFLLVNDTPYAMPFATNVLAALSGGAYTSSSSMAYLDGYVIFSQRNSNQFYWTDNYNTTADGANFANAEANPDRLVTTIVNNLDLWLFNTKSTEIWYDYGENDITFARRGNAMLETGCLAARSACKIDGTVAWLAGDDRGGAQLVMANGYTPQRVSTYAIEQQWQAIDSATLAQATAYTMQDGGHFFYVLNIPGQTTTWVFDATVSKQLGKPCWHEWRSSDGNGTEIAHIGIGHVFANGYHLTGDADGNLYEMSSTEYADNGNYYVVERTSPHISNEMNRIRYSNLTLNFLTGGTQSQTLDPQVMMQYSDDGGMTWSDERLESCGKIGEYGLKINYHRLGKARSRVFRIRASDGQYWALSGASMEIVAGSN